MATSMSCAVLRRYSVNTGLVILRIDKHFSFDPGVSEPVIEIIIQGMFDEARIVRALEKIAEEELDEVTVTDDTVVLEGPFMGSYTLSGKVQWRQAEYELSDFAKAYSSLAKWAEGLQDKLTQAMSRASRVQKFAESLLSRARIKQASFQPNSPGWIAHQREIDILSRLLRRLES